MWLCFADRVNPRPIDLLVLGGTSWLGGAVAAAALARGHRVTCLARGRSGEVPPGAVLVVGDRDQPDGYDAVADRAWDAVVDVTRQPLHVGTGLRRLSGRVRHWVLVSTLSVYADDATPGTDEEAPVHVPWRGEGLAPDHAYGEAKVACERALLAAEPAALVARAGLIVGYGDRSDRFGYWPARFARAAAGEPVLGPPLADPCQVVDVVDLAAWLVTCAERRTGGVVNAVGPTRSIGEVLECCRQRAGTDARLVEAPGDWLAGRGVEPWMGPESLPLWLPQPEYAGHATRRRDRAVAAGLVARPLAATVDAALAWEHEQGLSRARAAGLTPGREAALLGDLDRHPAR